MQRISTEKVSPGIGPYSQAVKANGFVFVSGQLGLEAQTSRIVEGGIGAETIQALTTSARY